MIERFYLKDFLSFSEVELKLNNGLIVFTGPSGSGKSILISSILSSFGLDECDAGVCESTTSWSFDATDFGLENDDINIFKQIKKTKARYFLNSQGVSKKTISQISSNHLKHLSLRDYSDFENTNILDILDARIDKKIGTISELKNSLKDSFYRFKELDIELKKIENEQKQIFELKEFTKFEIQKIDEISPKQGEDETLLKIKKELSKKEKTAEAISHANNIFSNEHSVYDALDMLEVDSSFFSDAMNELRAVLDGANERFEALDEIDVEEVLNRLESLSELKRKYGGISQALDYKHQKILELEKYENIDILKSDLHKEHSILKSKVQSYADELTILRNGELESFQNDLNTFLKELYIRDATVSLNKIQIDTFGADEIYIELDNTGLSKISTGEFNRVRLALLALRANVSSSNNGVLILDEIDANLSGEESMSVAKVLKKLSKSFQIFVISHQPQLTSMGDQHFLVYKQNDNSFVKELSFEQKIDEIARIISGDKVSKEAREFAKELLNV